VSAEKGLPLDSQSELNTGELFCPSWYRRGTNDARLYTKGEARLIRVNDGEQNVPALLLSADLADQITDAICSGRRYRRQKMSSDEKLAALETQRVKSIARLQSAEFRLKQYKKLLKSRKHSCSSTEQDALEDLLEQRCQAVSDVERAERSAKTEELVVQKALDEWRQNWVDLEEDFDEVWMDAELLKQPQVSADENESSETTGQHETRATMGDVAAAGNEADHNELGQDRDRGQETPAVGQSKILEPKSWETILAIAATYFLNVRGDAFYQAHEELKRYAQNFEGEFEKWASSPERNNNLERELREVFRIRYLKEVARLGGVSLETMEAFDSARIKAEASNLQVIRELVADPDRNPMAQPDAGPDEEAFAHQQDTDLEAISRWKTMSQSPGGESVIDRPRTPPPSSDLEAFPEDETAYTPMDALRRVADTYPDDDASLTEAELTSQKANTPFAVGPIVHLREDGSNPSVPLKLTAITEPTGTGVEVNPGVGRPTTQGSADLGDGSNGGNQKVKKTAIHSAESDLKDTNVVSDSSRGSKRKRRGSSGTSDKRRKMGEEVAVLARAPAQAQVPPRAVGTDNLDTPMIDVGVNANNGVENRDVEHAAKKVQPGGYQQETRASKAKKKDILPTNSAPDGRMTRPPNLIGVHLGGKDSSHWKQMRENKKQIESRKAGKSSHRDERLKAGKMQDVAAEDASVA
jgi:DNA-binding transcriptional MerR regulator